MAKAKILYLKQNDRQPYYYVKVRDSNNNTVPLSGATIVCTMKEARTGTVKINRQSTGISITGASNGEFHYEWQSGETDTVGIYHIEFEVDPAGLFEKWTIPTNPNEPAEVHIVSSLDTV